MTRRKFNFPKWKVLTFYVSFEFREYFDRRNQNFSQVLTVFHRIYVNKGYQVNIGTGMLGYLLLSNFFHKI